MEQLGWKVMGTALIAVVVLSCLRTGLYFTVDIYPVWIGYGILCTVAGLWGLHASVRARNPLKSFPANIPAARSAVVFLLCPFLMIFIYALHGFNGSLSVLGSFNQVVRWGMYASFALMAYCIAYRAGGRSVLAAAWHMAGAVFAVTALLPVYGLLPLPFAVTHSSNPEISATGARLAGLLQYPNTFGMLMAAFLLERLFALVPLLETQPKAGRILLGSLPLLPYAATLLLSESRGAWLAAGAAFAAGLLLERRRMLLPLVLAAAPIGGAALLYRQLADAKLAAAPWPGLLVLAGLWAGGMLAGLWLLRLRGEAAGALCRLAIAAGGMLWTAGAAAVFLTVRERIVKNFSTVSAREAMFRDAWRLVKEAPWLGQGGDTWRLSYRAIQSHPYVGGQMHSGYLDTLLNTGLLGLGILTLMLTSAAVLICRNNRLLFPSFAVIMIHGLIDFDWSYGVVWLLFFLLAAWGSVRDMTQVEKKWNFSSWPRFIPAAVLVICLMTVTGSSYLAYRAQMGSMQHMSAMREPIGGQAVAKLQAALQWNPADYTSSLDLARMLPPDEADKVLRKSLSYTPGHPGLLWALARNAGTREDAEAAVYWIQAGIEKDKYNAGEQTKSLESLLQLARVELSSGNTAKARQVVQTGLEIYREYVLAAQNTRRQDILNDRDYLLTLEAKEWGVQLARLAESIPGPVK